MQLSAAVNKAKSPLDSLRKHCAHLTKMQNLFGEDLDREAKLQALKKIDDHVTKKGSFFRSKAQLLRVVPNFNESDLTSIESTWFKPTPRSKSEEALLLDRFYNASNELGDQLNDRLSLIEEELKKVKNRLYEDSEILEPYLAEIKPLIDRGANINRRDKYGQTPLMKAVLIGSKDLMNTLILEGANLDIQDNQGQTALHHAISSLHYACWCKYRSRYVPITELYPNGIQDADYFSRRVTCALESVQEDYSYLVRILIENNAKIDVTNVLNQTPFMLASKCGFPLILKLLFDAGANPHVRNTRGQDCLAVCSDDHMAISSIVHWPVNAYTSTVLPRGVMNPKAQQFVMEAMKKYKELPPPKTN